MAIGDVKVCLIDKRNDSATRSNFTQNTGSTDGFRGLRVRHSVTMTAAGHVASIHVLVLKKRFLMKKAQLGLF